MTLIDSKQLSPFSGAAASPGEHKRELSAPAPLQDEVSECAAPSSITLFLFGILLLAEITLWMKALSFFFFFFHYPKHITHKKLEKLINNLAAFGGYFGHQTSRSQ